MNTDDIPLTSSQLTILGLVGALVLVSVTAPMLFAPSSSTASTPANNGTVYTPNQQTAASSNQSDATDSGGFNSGPIQRLSYGNADLSSVPDTHVDSSTSSSTPEISSSAGAQTLRVRTTTVNGSAALNLTDEQAHEGRWVSVSTDWLEAEHGSVPAVATVAHENGSTYTEAVRVRDGQAVFWVREFSTNLVTFGGEVEIVDRPATTGTTHLYEIRDLDNATDPVVQLTGVENSEVDTESATGLANGDSLSLSVADTTLPTTNANATFTGVEQLTTSDTLVDTTLSDGGTATYSVDGNLPASDVSVLLEGRETSSTASTSAASLSNGETTSYFVNGNVPASDGSVTFTGESSTNEQSISGNAVGPSSSHSLSVGGNLEPTGPSASNNPELTVTANGGSASTNVVDDEGDGTTDDDMRLVGDTSAGVVSGSEIEFTPSNSGEMTGITLDIETAYGFNYYGSVPVYVIPEGADGDYSDASAGTQVATWTPAYSTGPQSISFDTTVSVESGQTYVVQVGAPESSNGDSQSDILWLATDDSAASVATSEDGTLQNQYGDMTYDITGSVSGLSASTDDGTSVDIGSLSDGETTTVELPFSSSTSSLTFDGSGFATLDYSLSWTERSATEDPSIDVDGDGSTDASYNGVLMSGQTVTRSISNIPTGSQTATVSTGYRTDVDISWTETTATEDPSIDVDGDGSTDASYNGILRSGETVSRDVGNISTGQHTATASTTAHEVGVEVGSTTTTATQNPSLDIDGDGTAEASHSGTLTAGESVTVPISEFDSSVSAADVGLDAGTVDVSVAYTERVQTTDAGVIVNGQPLQMSGTLSDGQSMTLTGNSTWLQSGENNVSVVAGDGTLSNDAPARTVDLTYRHETTTERSVIYQNEVYSERYNISRTYLSDRQNATLRINHADNVISMRSLEARTNESGGWASVPESASQLSGTTLELDISSLFGGEVPAGATIEVRSVGSKIDVHNGRVEVIEATPVGYQLNSRVRLTEWGADSYVGVGNTSQGTVLSYAENESYSAESDYAEFSGKHGQRLHFPDAVSGSAVTVRTLPLRFDTSGTIRVSVPEGSVNATSPAFYVNPGSAAGDEFNVTYVSASEGEWYGAFEVDTSRRIDRVEGQGTMTVANDDIDSLIRVRPATAPSDDNAVSVYQAVSRGNLLGLTLLFGVIALLIGVGRAPERSRATVDSVATSTAQLVERLPRVGTVAADPVRRAIEAVGDAVVTLGENELLTGAVSAALLAAAIQSGYLQIGPEIGAMLAVAGIAIGSLILLIRVGEFTTARWGGINLVSGVVALQALGQGDLLTELINSDAFIIVLIIVAYVAVQLVREYRANNSPGDDQPRFVINTDRGDE